MRKNPETIEYLRTLSPLKLNEIMKPLVFGTSGLRGSMGIGFGQINEITIILATQAICLYLDKQNISPRVVVIGYDHRHNSIEYAKVTAAVFLKRNFTVYFFENVCHTPMVPFSVLELNAACGIMITASHNPKNDNGYKLYWKNGCQIISPVDKEIQKLMSTDEIWIWDKQILDNVSLLGKEIEDKYFRRVKSLLDANLNNTRVDVKCAYTPLHGVGLKYAEKLFEMMSFKPFICVPEQAHPDPEFPTVKFPNPEEGEEVMHRAIELAKDRNVSIIYANDPDADRLAVVEKINDQVHRMLTGNELGIILGAYLWQINRKLKEKCAIIKTVVSSSMLNRIGRVEGFTVEETLVGFKWIGNKALELRRKGYDILLGYEEAIGYMVFDEVVADKDGISALGMVHLMVQDLYNQGKTLVGFLEELYSKYGYFSAYNSYYRIESRSDNQLLLERISQQMKLQESSYKIQHFRDLRNGYDSREQDKQAKLPSTQMLTYWIVEGEREFIITFRISGTEPKLKFYSEVRGTWENRNVLEKDLKVFVDDLVDFCVKEKDC